MNPVAPQNNANFHIPFLDMIDLACADVGGRVLFATDDFFAEKEQLLKPEPPVFIADKYTEQGKWMDGWESRRKRTRGHDHCIIKLGLPGIIHGFDVDTAFFTGNHPEYVSIEGCCIDTLDPSVSELDSATTKWLPLIKKTRLQGGSHNLLPVSTTITAERITHLRMHIYPDGGVARLRVHGEVVPDHSKSNLDVHGMLDVAAVASGASVIATSDAYFGPKDNLIKPGRAATMGGGWETRRRRGDGSDWIVVRLGCTSIIERIEIDTHHFKGNYPDAFSFEVCRFESRDLLACDLRDRQDLDWREIIAPTKLQPDHAHQFDVGNAAKGPVDYVKLRIYPDGGVSRLRIWGKPYGSDT